GHLRDGVHSVGLADFEDPLGAKLFTRPGVDLHDPPRYGGMDQGLSILAPDAERVGFGLSDLRLRRVDVLPADLRQALQAGPRGLQLLPRALDGLAPRVETRSRRNAALDQELVAAQLLFRGGELRSDPRVLGAL